MLPKLRVLIVEDEALVAIDAETTLEEGGHIVTVSNTGRGAMAQISAGSFDVAVVDLGLPDIDGVALIAWMQQAAPGMRIVVSTGYSNQGEDAVSRRLPVGVPVVEKPGTRQDLLDAVARVARIFTTPWLDRRRRTEYRPAEWSSTTLAA